MEPPTAKFALRLALYQLDKLIKEGIPQDGFERTREFLTKYVNVLTRTKSAELGYAIDSIWYGIPDYVEMVKNGDGEAHARGCESRDQRRACAPIAW